MHGNEKDVRDMQQLFCLREFVLRSDPSTDSQEAIFLEESLDKVTVTLSLASGRGSSRLDTELILVDAS